jgi:Mce-associated membrane protein
MAVADDRATGSLITSSGRIDAAPERRWRVVVLVLGAALVVFCTVALYFCAQAVSAFAAQHGRSNALDAAEQVATSLTSFDYTHADEDAARIKASTTANFANGFAENTPVFIKMLRTRQVKMTSQVIEAGVTSYASDRAHVLVAIKSQTTDGQHTQPQPRDYRMDISLVYQHGSWLADSAEFVS